MIVSTRWLFWQKMSDFYFCLKNYPKGGPLDDFFPNFSLHKPNNFASFLLVYHLFSSAWDYSTSYTYLYTRKLWVPGHVLHHPYQYSVCLCCYLYCHCWCCSYLFFVLSSYHISKISNFGQIPYPLTPKCTYIILACSLT